MKVFSIYYIKEAKLYSNLFNSEDLSEFILSVDTDFWVNHTKPLKALKWARNTVDWPLSELHNNHEFLFIFEVKYYI